MKKWSIAYSIHIYENEPKKTHTHTPHWKRKNVIKLIKAKEPTSTTVKYCKMRARTRRSMGTNAFCGNSTVVFIRATATATATRAKNMATAEENLFYG